MRPIPGVLAASFLCAAVAVFATACGGDSKEPTVQVSGFLGDYSQLAPGGEGRARLIYINPEADFSLYDKLMIEPVALWDPERSAPMITPSPDQIRLAEHLQRALESHLGQDLAIVGRAEPGTLSLRMAITRAEGHRAGVELEIIDVTSRTRLVGAVDDQDVSATVGAKSTDPLAETFDHWASLIRMRLAAFRNFDAAQKALDRAAVP
jgi:hypothetical protein